MNDLRNSVQLIGDLGKNVDFKMLENGNALARVSISTREVFKNSKGEKKVDLQWHNLVGWGKVAEIMQVLFEKGKKVAIKGKLRHRSYQDREGKTRYHSEIVVNEFMLL